MSEKEQETRIPSRHPKITALSTAFPMSIESARPEISTNAQGPVGQDEGITRPPHLHFIDR